MNKKAVHIIVVALIAILILWKYTYKSTPATSEHESITIGAALSLTGDAAEWGEAEKSGINLALKEIGSTTSVVFEDTKSSSQDSVSAVQKLVSFDKIQYIVGPTWLDSYPGAQGVVKGKNVIMITPSSSISAVQSTEVVPNVFSTWYRVNALTSGLAQSVKEKGFTKVSLVFQNDAYFTEFISFFKKAAQSQGIEIVSEDLINPGTSDFKTVLSKAKSAGAQGVVFGMYDEKMVAGFLKGHAQVLPNVTLFSNENARQYATDPEYAKYMEGSVFVENASVTADFVTKYKKVYGTDPVLSASTAYDAVNILVESIKNDPKNPVDY
ncbi:MAG TPA: ABC transporter substrate-binding protein, partial [Candidatus Paceibacterota bacterium]